MNNSNRFFVEMSEMIWGVGKRVSEILLLEIDGTEFFEKESYEPLWCPMASSTRVGAWLANLFHHYDL